MLIVQIWCIYKESYPSTRDPIWCRIRTWRFSPLSPLEEDWTRREKAKASHAQRQTDATEMNFLKKKWSGFNLGVRSPRRMCFYFIIQFLVPPSSSDLCVQQRLRKHLHSQPVSLPPGHSSSLAPGLLPSRIPPFPEASYEPTKDREIGVALSGDARLPEGCAHPSKELLLGDISEESREAPAWTLIQLGGR